MVDLVILHEDPRNLVNNFDSVDLTSLLIHFLGVNGIHTIFMEQMSNIFAQVGLQVMLFIRHSVYICSTGVSI
jgi:ABC-type uncharacterized transport system permease subunit